MLGASQHRREVWWGEGKGEEADTWGSRGPCTHAHVILYTSTASIEASLDYYTDKNVVLPLRPARMTDREGTPRLC